MRTPAGIVLSVLLWGLAAAAGEARTPATVKVPRSAQRQPALKEMPECDASRDAAGLGQLFESIHIKGFTDLREGTNGFALTDLNRDGLLDIIATYSPPRGNSLPATSAGKLRVFINQGDFCFQAQPPKVLACEASPENFSRGQVPALADFNGDGLLDIFVTRHSTKPVAGSLGNSLFVTQDAWDTWVDVSDKMGIRNEQAYNRQPVFGDVNRDGWLDIAVGCDNIKNAQGGVPHSRLYLFKPRGEQFEDGTFTDIGGTELIPDFGGFYHDSDRDKAGPDINLCDLDNDGDLDLLQSCHVDVREPLLPYSPGEYRQGIFCWKNLLSEQGKLRFEKVTGNGLSCEARLEYNKEKQSYEARGKAPGLPYLSLADVDNDGLQDVLAVGPAHPGWAPRTEYVGGRFWRNLGKFRFEEATQQAHFSALNFTRREWLQFFEVPQDSERLRPTGTYPSQPGLARQDSLDITPYYADVIFGDFDNDGWQDVVVLDRTETTREPARAILFMNRGGGVFEPRPTNFSGLDGTGICGEAADLNNDGLLDLVFAADPDNSGGGASLDRYEDKVYWNTGAHGGTDNHWLRVCFRGISDAQLIGARVLLYQAGQAAQPEARLLGTRVISSSHSYKSGGALEAHFGLGQLISADVVVLLLSGRRITYTHVEADRFLILDLERSLKPIVVPTITK